MGLRGVYAKTKKQRLKEVDEARQYLNNWDLPSLTRAQRVISFCEDMTVTSGQFAFTKLQLRPWQKDFINSVYRTRSDKIRPVRTAVLSLGRKNGKGLALDTPVPTPRGWTSMAALKVGDEVFDEHGEVCRVNYVSPVHLGLRCWRFRFADGSEIVADQDHQWLTRHSYQPWKDLFAAPHGGGTRPRQAIVTTPQIAASLYKLRPDGVHEHNHKIAVAGALCCQKTDLLIPPYVLGYWLGDGDTDTAAITVGEADELFVCENFEQELGYALLAGKRYQDRAPRYRISRGRGVDPTNSVQAQLRAIGVLGCKHIPESYLWAAREQRLALLQGLMDSDGTAAGGNLRAPRCYFDVTDERLARDTLQLVRSLGFKATIIEDIARLNGRPIGPVWSVSFTAYRADAVFRLPRKLEKLSVLRHARSRSNAIIACDEIASVPTVCIQVDSPSHLFLAGEGMTPTHNTQLAAALALCHLSGPEAENRGEVYACANDRFQAGKIFNEMCAMIDANKWLSSRTNIIRFRKDIHDLVNDSIYATLTAEAKTKMGLNPSFVCYDELGQADSRELYDAMDSAMGGRKEPLLMVISTQAADDGAPLSQLIDYGLQVNAGKIVDESFHMTFYAAPADADPWDEKTWRQANPALGDFRSLDDLQRMASQAQRMPSLENSFRNLILNQRIAMEERFIRIIDWDACAGEPLIPEGARVYAGLDLGATKDLSALAIAYEDGQKVFHVNLYCWLPGDPRDRGNEDRQPYDVWVRQGFLTAAGIATNPAVIARKIAEINGRNPIEALAFDPWKFHELQRELDAISCRVPLFKHGQGYRDMSSSVDGLERAIAEKRLRHGGHPVLTMAAMNAVVTRDPAGNKKFDKAKSNGRIDPLVAVAMAMALPGRAEKPVFDVQALIA